MKTIAKLTAAAALLGGALSPAFAQTQIAVGNQALLAGWDFNNISTSTIGSTNARYSDIWGDVTASPFSVNAGTFFVNGTAGSDTWPTITRTGSGDIDRSIVGRLATAGLGSLSGAEGSLSATGTIDANRNEFAFQVDTLNSVNSFSNVNFSFFARDSANAGNITVNWFYSIDGGATKINTSLSSIVSGNVFSEYQVNLSSIAALTGVENLSIIGAISEANASSVFQLDNLAVYGSAATAIPEPSTYAAILSALTAGIVALRRRRSLIAA